LLGEFTGVYLMANKKSVDWEKIGVYISILAVFFTIISHVIEMREKIAKLEVKVEKLERFLG